MAALALPTAAGAATLPWSWAPVRTLTTDVQQVTKLVKALEPAKAKKPKRKRK
ncbi:MAG TPA: hypothetical protein VHX88_21455 [Solirubrobacteraceae bacterium]|nr:hypothetical protein [Solirubrobacteraceae bacterium]